MPDLSGMDTMENILFKYDSTFKKQIDKAKQSLTGPKAEQYKKLTTSLEKFKFWRENFPKFEVVAKCPNKPDLKKSMEYKELGNKLFKENKHKDARKMYTKSLQLFPFNYQNPSDNKDFSILLANRSATLDVTGPYYEELQDIALAFKFGYPKELYYKLYNRKGHTLLMLKQLVDSKEVFKECQNWIGKSDLTEKQRDQWRHRMAKQMNVFGCTKKLANTVPPVRPLKEKLEKLTDKINLNDDKSNVLAVEDLQTEDLLFKEKCYASVLFNDDLEEESTCPITYGKLAAPIPCSFGSHMVFSSLEARDKANSSFHQYEWSILESMKEFGLSPVARLALRLVTSLPPADCKKLVDELRSQDSKSGSADNLSEQAKVFSLPTKSNLSLDNSICVYLLINYFMECLKVGKYISKDDMTGDLVYLLARAILVACEHSIPLAFGDFLSNKGELWNMNKYPVSYYAQGIFSKLSMLTHISQKVAAQTGSGSDVIKFFQDDTIIVQSFRDIKAGKPVNLGDEIRGKMESMMPADMIPFKCNGKDCGLSFPLHEKTNQNTINCPSESCGIETNIWQKRKRIVEIRAQYDAVRGEVEKGNIRSAINYLHDLIAEWDKIVARPYKEFTKLEEHLTKIMLMEHTDNEDSWIGFSSHWLRRAK